MTEHEASRTLVKSPPELWAECSEAASLSRHLDRFGEITITRLEPETAVAWEGEIASGTVRLEPSGWGTRVILTARAADDGRPEPAISAEPKAEPAPMAVPDPSSEASSVDAGADGRQPRPRDTIFGRMRALFRRAPAPEVEGTEPAPRVVSTEHELARPGAPRKPPVFEAVDVQPGTEPAHVLNPNDALVSALDSLGAAHHRPYSRS